MSLPAEIRSSSAGCAPFPAAIRMATIPMWVTRTRDAASPTPEEIEALHEVRERLRDVPGRTELRVVVWRKGEEPLGPGLPDSPSSTRPMTLREFRERLGGDTGHLPDPERGELHFVSIEQWANENPDETYVMPVLTFRPDDAHAAEWFDEWQKHLKRFPPDQET